MVGGQGLMYVESPWPMRCLTAAVVLTAQARAVLAVVAQTRAWLKHARHGRGIDSAHLP